MGLVSDGGVHAQMSHLYALLEIAKAEQFGEKVYLHLFTDGRDSSPTSGVRFFGRSDETMYFTWCRKDSDGHGEVFWNGSRSSLGENRKSIQGAH